MAREALQKLKENREARKERREEGNKRDHAAFQSLIIQNRRLRQFWILICFFHHGVFFSLPPFTYTADFMSVASRDY